MEEEQKEIAEFEQSWQDTLSRFQLFVKNGFDHLVPLRDLILDLKEKGESEHFRIGSSLYFLIFSISKEFGLKSDQNYLRIEAIKVDHFEVIYFKGKERFTEIIISDLKDQRFRELLNLLKQAEN